MSNSEGHPLTLLYRRLFDFSDVVEDDRVAAEVTGGHRILGRPDGLKLWTQASLAACSRIDHRGMCDGRGYRAVGFSAVGLGATLDCRVAYRIRGALYRRAGI